MELGAFLKDKLKIKRADDVLDDLRLMARMGESSPQMVIDEVERLAGRGCFGSVNQINEFFQYYFAVCNNTRLDANRGFTPNEIQRGMGGSMPGSFEFGPNISHALHTGALDIGELRQGILGSVVPAPVKASMLKDLKCVELKKPGRNDPCPCGSGKKYKRCCGR